MRVRSALRMEQGRGKRSSLRVRNSGIGRVVTKSGGSEGLWSNYRIWKIKSSTLEKQGHQTQGWKRRWREIL